MDTLRLDLAFALRAIRRNPLFTLTVAATLALGVGAATAVFGVTHAVLLEPLPIRDEDQVVVLRKEALVGNETFMPFSLADLRDFGRQSRTLASVGGVQYDGAWPGTFLDGERVLTVATAMVSGNFFQVLDARTSAGRLLTPDDDVPGAEPVGVISHALWQRTFGGDSSVIDRAIRGTSGTRLRIVGVMAPGFAFPGNAELWVPLLPVMPNALQPDGPAPFSFVGRLRPGASPEAAREELAAFLEHKTYVPGESRDVRGAVRPIASLITGDVRPVLLALAGAVSLLLLIACVNVATLFTVRGMARRREFAVRVAIGAGGPRLVRQLVTEGVVLAAVGGAVGILMAAWLLRLFVALAPAELPRADTIGIDPMVLAAAGVIILLSGLGCSLWPAVIIARRRQLGRDLRSGSRAGASDRAAHRRGGVLVAAQVALAVIVLVGAGLLVRTLTTLYRLDLGFAAPQLSTARLSLPREVVASRPRLASFYERLTERLESTPGVSAATVSMLPPFSERNGWDAFFTVEGQGPADVSANPALDFQAVLADHFSAMGIPVLRGRGISADDREGGDPVVVVSESLARLGWPGQDPLGRRLKFGPADSPFPWHTVVGVVPDVRYRELTNPRPVVYAAWAQAAHLPPLSLLMIRSAPARAPTMAELAALVRQIEPGVLVTETATMRERVGASLATERFSAILVAAFAVIALVLATIGVHGVIAALVRQRTAEIGIRVALGAQARDVRRIVLGWGLIVAGVGVVLGVAVSLGVTRLLRTVLYGVSPHDPLTILAAASVLMAVAGLACWRPTRVATRVDPLITLRAD